MKNENVEKLLYATYTYVKDNLDKINGIISDEQNKDVVPQFQPDDFSTFKKNAFKTMKKVNRELKELKEI